MSDKPGTDKIPRYKKMTAREIAAVVGEDFPVVVSTVSMRREAHRRSEVALKRALEKK
jgi:hypothetical protein